MKQYTVVELCKLERQGNRRKQSGSRIIIAETRGACVIARNWTGPEGGPRSTWASRRESELDRESAPAWKFLAKSAYIFYGSLNLGKNKLGSER